MCRKTAAPSTASTRLPVCDTRYWRIQLSAPPKITKMASADAITTSVLVVWWTMTLSMMTWLHSGVANAMSWMNSDASSTSRHTLRCRASSE